MGKEEGGCEGVGVGAGEGGYAVKRLGGEEVAMQGRGRGEVYMCVCGRGRGGLTALAFSSLGCRSRTVMKRREDVAVRNSISALGCIP